MYTCCLTENSLIDSEAESKRENGEDIESKEAHLKKVLEKIPDSIRESFLLDMEAIAKAQDFEI